MKLHNVLYLTAIFCLTFAFNAESFGQKTASKKTTKVSEEIRRANSSANVFKTIMKAPDNAIPSAVLDKANCIAVFPNVLKAAFGIGGRYGKGLLSCRTASGWSSPAYLRMAGGSFGWQIGGQSTDFVLLFMTEDGIESLLSNKFTLGTEASVAAGPVGRTVGASTDLYLESQILTYSRTKGLFAGLSLKGVSIAPDTKAIEKVYGKEKTAEMLIKQQSRLAPNSVEVYPNTLRRYTR